MGKDSVATSIFSTSSRHVDYRYVRQMQRGSSISYDKQTGNVRDTGCNYDKEDEDTIAIKGFRDKLYALFKKDKETWDEEDTFLIKAVSDYLPLAMEYAMKDDFEEGSFDLFHYAFIVPSEWEEEIRDDIIRPISVQSGLISNEDHQDRLLFFSDIESIFYNFSFKRGDNTILCRITPDEGKAISLIADDIEDRIAEFLRTNLFYVDTDDDRVRKPLKRFLKGKLVSFDEDRIIEAIMEQMNRQPLPPLSKKKKKKGTKTKPWIMFKNKWMLTENQKRFIMSLPPLSVCAEIGSFLFSDLKGACIGIFEAIQHSDMYCKPHIMQSEDPTTSSSVFLNSKPDAIVNLVYFIDNDEVSMKNDLLFEMKAILTKELSHGEALISTYKPEYIKAFILMYMIYIKEEILNKLPDHLISDQMDMKIGYATSIEAMLLNNIIGTKDSLQDIIFASGLVPKDDDSKKLRITTQGERILPAIQKSLKLELSLKSYFLVCQLHEDYVQLSLHQVVTAPCSDEEEQESIIVQDEILDIPNIYDSLCTSMWHSLVQDSSLIELCEMHITSDDNKILDLFSSKTKKELFANLKKEEADDFNLELGIDTSCLLVPELFSQLLQPVISQRPLCYKDFEIGALQQVCSENYAVGISKYEQFRALYKSKITDTETIVCDDHIVFPFLNKRELISNVRSNRPFYLRNQEDSMFYNFSTGNNIPK
ncbi:hypothetical protein HPULCUR_007503 [Helicostylum pulchrum]|uniref:Uncharacterized protein n=1 Tax=Helicostylum pulchrum TaxID=562976 RepID=A0ABP9Y636_9FUNG